MTMTLIRALAWRTRAEGLRYLFIPVGLFALGLTISFATGGSGHKNGGQLFAAFAGRFGAHTGAVTAGFALLTGPGVVALFAAMSVALVLRNMIGTEASRGGIELLLAGPYRPRQVMVAILGYAIVLGTGYWAMMSGLTAIAIAVLLRVAGASVTLTASYLLTASLLPLLATWAGTALATGVNLLFPKVAQMGSYGLINTGGGGLGTVPALLPGIATMFAFLLWAPHISAGALLAAAGGIAVVLIVAAVAVVSARFRPDAVLES